MEPLDRYLNAVRFWLPRAQRQDIIQELSEDIRSQIEEREAEIGHPLDEADIDVVLHRYGHPMVVAGRFLPARCLIGPTLFPLYAFVLKLLAGVYVVPWLVVWLFFVIFVPSYRANHPGPDLSTLRSVWMIAIHGFAFVTLGFAIIERSAGSRLLSTWSVRKLPAPRDPNHISRGASVTSIVTALVFVLWWVGVMSLPTPEGVRLAPVVRHLFYWPILLLALAVIPVAVIDVIRPWWSRQRAAVALVLDGAWLVMTSLLLASAPLVEVTSPNVTPERAAQAAQWLSLPLLFTAFLCAVSYALRAIQDVRRLVGKPPAQSRAITFLTGE